MFEGLEPMTTVVGGRYLDDWATEGSTVQWPRSTLFAEVPVNKRFVTYQVLNNENYFMSSSDRDPNLVSDITMFIWTKNRDARSWVISSETSPSTSGFVFFPKEK